MCHRFIPCADQAVRQNHPLLPLPDVVVPVHLLLRQHRGSPAVTELRTLVAVGPCTQSARRRHPGPRVQPRLLQGTPARTSIFTELDG